jgi:hypothetical protein
MGATRVYEPRIIHWNADSPASLLDATSSHWKHIPFFPHRAHRRFGAGSWSFRAQDLDIWHASQTNMSAPKPLPIWRSSP